MSSSSIPASSHGARSAHVLMSSRMSSNRASMWPRKSSIPEFMSPRPEFVSPSLLHLESRKYSTPA